MAPLPYNPIPSIPPAAPSWGAPDQQWEMAPFGPRLPKELTEVKQTVESLRKEVSELKETIKVLETQIQLLNRNFLLNEKVREKEKGN
jgi:predicted RNase H-like nuclease (RuvC/YqgF family)